MPTYGWPLEKSYSYLGEDRSYVSRFFPSVNNFQVAFSHIVFWGLECCVRDARLAIWAGLVNSELLCELSGKNHHSYSRYEPVITLLSLSPYRVENCIPWGWDLGDLGGEVVKIRNRSLSRNGMMGGSNNGVSCVDSRRAVGASSVSRLSGGNPTKRVCFIYNLWKGL